MCTIFSEIACAFSPCETGGIKARGIQSPVKIVHIAMKNKSGSALILRHRSVESEQKQDEHYQNKITKRCEIVQLQLPLHD